MSFRSTLLPAIGALFISAGFGQARVPAQAPSSRVMVVKPDVFVKNRDGTQISVGLGEVLTTTIRKDAWLWVPALHGWVPEKETIPLRDAVSFFTRAIRSTPTAEAWHHRALARAALGDHRQAIEDFDQAIAIEPRNAAMHVNRGNVYRDMEEAEKAIRDYNRALEFQPRLVRALNNRGLIFSAQEKYDQALLDFSAAIRIRPDYAEPRNHRGVVHWKQGRVVEAKRDYDAAVRLKSGLPEPHYNLGVLTQSQGDFERAIAHYQTALELDRDFVPANNDLAWLLATCPDESVRRPDLAVLYATRACQLTELKNANAIDTLAAALAASGRYDEAVRRIDQALRLSSDDARPPMKARKQLYIARQTFVDRG